MTDPDDGADGEPNRPPDATGDADSSDDAGAVRCWLVEREYDDKGLVTVVYATPDGRRRRRFQWAAASLARRDITAAREFDPDTLDPVPDPDREAYATEAERMAERHDPDEEV